MKKTRKLEKNQTRERNLRTISREALGQVTGGGVGTSPQGVGTSPQGIGTSPHGPKDDG